MKNKFISIILCVFTAASVMLIGSVNAFAIGIAPIAANEGKITMWIFAGLIAAAAIAGIAYFIIHKNKK